MGVLKYMYLSLSVTRGIYLSASLSGNLLSDPLCMQGSVVVPGAISCSGGTRRWCHSRLTGGDIRRFHVGGVYRGVRCDERSDVELGREARNAPARYAARNSGMSAVSSSRLGDTTGVS